MTKKYKPHTEPYARRRLKDGGSIEDDAAFVLTHGEYASLLGLSRLLDIPRTTLRRVLAKVGLTPAWAGRISYYPVAEVRQAVATYLAYVASLYELDGDSSEAKA